MSAKSIIKSIIRPLGYDVVRWIPDQFLPPFDILPGFFKAYIPDLLESNPDFFFVQVGAHDGVGMDPLRQSILAHHLRGLLIEPLPDAFSRLRENYRSEPQLLFENVAIGDDPGHIPFYRARSGEGGEKWQVLASFDRGHLTKHGVPPACIEEIRVEVDTLPSVLRKRQIQHVTLLQIDAEGQDYQIVKSAMDAGIRPKLINYESGNLEPTVGNACKHMLYNLGYRFIDVGIDTLCCLQSESASARAGGREET
jgi:FkbM family methyltransferase